MEIKKIGIVGAGQMGSGIAELFAIQGFSVLFMDLNAKILDQAFINISSSLAKLEQRGKLGQRKAQDILTLIQPSTSLADFHEVDFALEAIVENLEAKEKTFRTLDDIMPEEAILTSNTSSISITRLASDLKRKDKFCGMHFMNPPILIRLVEIIQGSETSKKTIQAVLELTQKLGYQGVVCKDSPGFLVNRILFPMINEAIMVLEEKLADASDIDKAMTIGTNQPIGPLALADLIGLDTCLYIMDILFTEFQEPKYQACTLLRDFVAKGMLGRKTGRGFFSY
jgi:3-hydroxybutyryl-CoA dehydrogenase